MRSIFSGTHPAQTIDRRNVDNVDKENESGGNRIMETKGLAQKTAKAAKVQGNVYKDYVNKKSTFKS